MKKEFGKQPKFKNIREIMSQPSLKAKLTNYIDEAVQCKSKIQFEQDNLKALREGAKEELGLKPAMFNQYTSMVFSNDYLQRKDKIEELSDLIDAVLQDIENEAPEIRHGDDV